MWKKGQEIQGCEKVSILLWSCPHEFIYVGALQYCKLKWRVTSNWSLPWQLRRYSISSTLLLCIIYMALAGGTTLCEASAWKYLDRCIHCVLCHPMSYVAILFTPSKCLHFNPKPVVLSPWFVMPSQSCPHIRRSWGWPWILFPAHVNDGVVICRAHLRLGFPSGLIWKPEPFLIWTHA